MTLPPVSLLSCAGMGIVALFALTKFHPVARVAARLRAHRDAPNV